MRQWIMQVKIIPCINIMYIRISISSPHHNSNNTLLQFKNCIAMIRIALNTNP
jgi:hypothetical protein